MKNIMNWYVPIYDTILYIFLYIILNIIHITDIFEYIINN